MDEIVNLTLGGFPIALGVVLVVQALKVSGLVSSGDQARVANLVTALIFAGVWAGQQIAPQIQPVVNVLYMALIGGLVAGLGYTAVEKFAEMRNGRG